MIYKELRKQRGETIKQTAEAIGISESHLGRIESGWRTLTKDIEAKLQKHFRDQTKAIASLKVGDKIEPKEGMEKKAANFAAGRVLKILKIIDAGFIVKNELGQDALIFNNEIYHYKKIGDKKANEIKVVHEPIIEIQNQVAQQLEQAEETHTQRCTRYRKPIPKDWDYIDVYRVCELFNVDDSSGATQQAMKKLIAAGTRGYKDKLQDYKEAQFAIDEKIKLLESAKDA